MSDKPTGEWVEDNKHEFFEATKDKSTTGEWTVKERALQAAKAWATVDISVPQLAAHFEEVINAALAAERKRADQQERFKWEANKKVQTLTDALKRMPEVAYEAIIEGAGVSVENLPNELQCIADAALEKVKAGK